jgi:hypothetical protein
MLASLPATQPETDQMGKHIDKTQTLESILFAQSISSVSNYLSSLERFVISKTAE